MKNKTTISFVFFAIMLIFAGYLSIKGRQAGTVRDDANTYKAPAPSVEAINEVSPVIDSVETKDSVITRTADGFSPKDISISVGDTVTFQNESDDPMWPASNPHPAHNGYPEDGGCRTSTFDACKGIAPHDTWTFTFFDRGTWGFHDHLSPQFTGTITVR